MLSALLMMEVNTRHYSKLTRMQRRKFLRRSIAGGMAVGFAGAATPLFGAQTASGHHSDLPSRFTPTAYSQPSSKYNPFTIPDYYTYADDLTIERNRSGKPHQGKVLAAVEAHSD